MFIKLIFLLALGALGYFWVRARWGSKRRYPWRETQATLPPGERAATDMPFRRLVQGLLILLLVGSGVLLWLDWQEGRREVRVRVINTSDGNVLIYRARLGDIRQRGFTTLDGEQVWLAPVERLEVDARRP